MKYLLRFSLTYLITLALIFSFYITITNQYQKDLSLAENELEGVKYLSNIYQLTSNIIAYENLLHSHKNTPELKDTKKKLRYQISKIYHLQQKYPKFKNNALNKQLKQIENNVPTKQQIYMFLDSINNENYRISDISKLLFEEDRKIYFLGSLTSHYLAEFLVSAFISHHEIELFKYNKFIDTADKKLYTQQMKLLQLSSEELYEIIKLLDLYKDTKILNDIITEVLETIDSISEYNNFTQEWRYNANELQKYSKYSKKLLALSFQLNDENTKILYTTLSSKKQALQEKILINKIILFLTIILITTILFYFYRSFISNIKKDNEIKNINDTLDNLVLFSKTDINGNITYVSSALERLSGFSRDEMIGHSHSIFKHEDMKDSVYNDLWKTILAKKRWTGEIKNKAKDGSIYWVKAIISPEINDKGEVTGYHSHRENITDKKELEIEKIKTQEALKFKAMFLSNMSHEIRTPLNGIIGLTSVALKTQLDTKQKDIMHKVQSASNILLGVVNDILDISKIESGKMTIEKVNFNLKTLINNIESILTSKVQDQGIKLQIHYDEHLDSNFIGDSLRISQVLSNLLNNGIKFTSEGEVTLNVKDIGGNIIRFEVRDTGIGLKEEQLKTLFEEFTQADMSTSRKYGGTGLGLSISKNLVELMGGTISVTSDFGKGSTFSFEIPLETSSDKQISDEESDSIATLHENRLNSIENIHILVAEDNKMNQMVLSMLLEDSKLKLDFALDGNIAIEKFKQNNYDLILMDIQMPNLNGYDATTAIRSINADIPIIGLSANAMQEDIKKALDVGMNDYLAKPIDVKKLYKTLSKYLIKE